ncbi:MAG: U32 family peptidase [Candidatus Diapherotrites archaeon]|nr:U32 family peptidase [Candidatus Diapherotrites archaeon]
MRRNHSTAKKIPMSKKPELCVGVGDFASAIAAATNGADAVYFGVRGFNMRDLGTNFSASDMKKLMASLHASDMKGYLALNTIIFDGEIKQVEKILKEAKRAKVDGVILWDFSVLSLAKKFKLKPFLSTQASVSNSEALKQYSSLGIKRIILARELSLKQISKIKKIAKKLGIEVECFIHGAMCISVSGRCFLSHELFGRSANRGQCLQPCRRAYFLDGDFPNFEKKEIFLDGSTILSAKDLKTIDFLDKIIWVGVDSLKIEGRTKPSDYIAVATRCYRQAIDSVFEGTFSKEKIARWNSELEKVYNRGFSNGFFFSVPDEKDLAKGQGSVQTQKRFNVGIITHYFVKPGVAEVKLFAPLSAGEKLIIEGVTTFIEQKLDSMEINHKKIKKARQGEFVGIKVSGRCRPNDKVFVLKRKPNK